MSCVLYPRPGQGGTDAERLRALADGYFRLLPIFFGALVFGYPFQAVLILSFHGFPAWGVVAWLAQSSLVAALCLRPLGKLGIGAGGSSGAVVAALALGLTSLICCGPLGFLFVFVWAVRQMRGLGVPTGFLGPTREAVYRRFREFDRTL